MHENLSHKELLEKIALLEKQIHELEKDLIHDGLTSLKTKAFFEEECNVYIKAIETADAGKRREWFGFRNLSILFFDTDHFKKINDTYGHDVGDVVLKKIAETISRNVRNGDTVCRWGGEEIAVCLLGANETDAKMKADSLRKKIEALTFDTPDLKVTISVGVASNFKGATCKVLLKNADLALYKAKGTGRNKVVAFSELN